MIMTGKNVWNSGRNGGPRAKGRAGHFFSIMILRIQLGNLGIWEFRNKISVVILRFPLVYTLLQYRF